MPTNFGTGNLSTNYNFLWSKPMSPNNSKDDLKFKIQNDKMLLTPLCEGDFNITLTIENLNNTNLYQETFSYYAINDINSSDIPVKQNIDSTDDSNKNNIKIWTIQIMSNPSIELARKKQLELNDKGFDAYTESVYLEDKDIEYWRVRIGNFTDKETGMKVVKNLRKLGYETWFTSFYQ